MFIILKVFRYDYEVRGFQRSDIVCFIFYELRNWDLSPEIVGDRD